MDWFRFYNGTVGDAKLQLIAKKLQVSGAEVVAMWVLCMEMANQSRNRGSIKKIDFEAIECLLGIAEGNAEKIYAQFIKRDMIDESGALTAWPERQSRHDRPSTTTPGADRIRKFREQQKAKKEAEPEKPKVRDVTQSNHREEEKREDNKDQEQNPSVDSSVTPVTPVEPETGKKPRAKRIKKTIDKEALSPGFIAFWEIYPVKDGKKVAWEAWQAFELEDMAPVLVRDVRDRIAGSVQWKRGYIPHASTYINQNRWNDPMNGTGPVSSRESVEQTNKTVAENWADPNKEP